MLFIGLMVGLAVSIFQATTQIQEATLAFIPKIVAILGSLSSLSQGTLKDYTLFGKSIFDIFDYTTSNIMLPVGGLFIVLFVGWKMKRSDVLDELTSGGTIPFKRNILDVTMFCIKFLAPVAISFVLLNSIGLIKFF